MQTLSAPLTAMVLEGLREILGDKTLTGFLAARPDGGKNPYCIHDLRRFWQKLEKDYGSLGAQGIVLRSGRCAFKYGMMHAGKEWGFTQNEYRLLPGPRRMLQGLEKLAAFFSKQGECTFAVEANEDGWAWSFPLVNEAELAKLIELWMMGLLQAFFTWTDSGKAHQISALPPVESPLPRALPRCAIQISAKAID